MSSLQAIAPRFPARSVTRAKVARADAYAKAAKSEATRRAYRTDWQAFSQWCAAHRMDSLPVRPETLAIYLSELATMGRKPATIGRALAAITQAHKAAHHESPRGAAAVRAVMQGIRRTHGTAQAQKSPVGVAQLRSMVEAAPDSLRGARDRAILLTGFAGAFRRSEIIGLDICDLEFGSEGVTIILRRSKTDQEGAGRRVGIPFGTAATCPVRALRAWLDASSIAKGAVFQGVNRHGRLTGKRLSPGDIARVVKAAARTLGLDAARFSGHSLRAGLATAAAKAGKSERAIMAQTGHRSVTMVRKYIRDADLFNDNAATGIGL